MPVVAIDVKLGKFSTHDVLTCSTEAIRHKEFGSVVSTLNTSTSTEPRVSLSFLGLLVLNPISNPLEVIEQITYLLFFKRLAKLRNRRGVEGQPGKKFSGWAAILTVVRFIPYLGGLVHFGVLCLGLGAFAGQLYRASRPVIMA